MSAAEPLSERPRRSVHDIVWSAASAFPDNSDDVAERVCEALDLDPSSTDPVVSLTPEVRTLLGIARAALVVFRLDLGTSDDLTWLAAMCAAHDAGKPQPCTGAFWCLASEHVAGCYADDGRAATEVSK